MRGLRHFYIFIMYFTIQIDTLVGIWVLNAGESVGLWLFTPTVLFFGWYLVLPALNIALLYVFSFLLFLPYQVGVKIFRTVINTYASEESEVSNG